MTVLLLIFDDEMPVTAGTTGPVVLESVNVDVELLVIGVVCVGLLLTEDEDDCAESEVEDVELLDREVDKDGV